VTVVALCSAKGSPGVTTLTCALGAVWPIGRRVLVAECDPSGGDLAVRFTLYARRGMTSLVLARRQGAPNDTDLASHIQCLPGGLEVLVGPPGAGSASTLDHEIAKMQGPVFPAEADLIVDCGRIVPGASGQRRLLVEADRLLVLARPDASGLANARWAIDRMRELDRAAVTSLILVGEGPFSAREASVDLGTDVLEVVPSDSRGAGVACGVPGKTRVFARSPLVTSARRIAQRIVLPQSERAGVDEVPRRVGPEHGVFEFVSTDQPARSAVLEATQFLQDTGVGTFTDGRVDDEVSQTISRHTVADRNGSGLPYECMHYDAQQKDSDAP